MCRIRFSAAVFDEAHKLKGAGSSTRAAAMSLDVTWKLLLTGVA
jgi:SNF2 family DNA or RNA helicase